jgi:hypothetical protein
MATRAMSTSAQVSDGLAMQAARPKGTPSRLPRLIDQRGIAEELGVTRAAAEKIMRLIPKVHVAGLRKVYVKRDDVLRVIEDGTRR